MRAIVAVMAMLAVPGAAAEGDQQFDLVCTAKKEVLRYRLDLGKMQYCAGECRATRPIAEVSEAEIALDRKEPAFRSDVTSRITINRSSGEWRTYIDIPGTGVPFTRDGICERAEFSGLPRAKF